MHFEIAAIRAIQTLGQATLTEVLDTLTAIRGGGPMPERPVAKAAPPPKPAAIPAPEKKNESKPAGGARPSLSAAVAASLDEKKPETPTPKPTAKVAEEPPTKTEAAAPATAAPASTLDTEALWPQLVERVRRERPLISEWVESGKLVEALNGVVVLAFPPDAGLARDACERANNRGFLEKVLGEIAGQPIALKTDTRAGIVVERLAREEAKPGAKADPMEAFKNDPLIQKALAEFKAEILPA
jgi:DNA polymerase-3 subunit gamma/tau